MVKSLSILLSLVLFAAGLSSCGSCKPDKRQVDGIGAQPEPAATTETTSKTPDKSGAVDDGKEHEVKDDVAVLETTDKTINTKILFTAGNDNMLDGRYLAEYLMIVRATDESCIRLRFRPSADYEAGVDAKRFDPEAELLCGRTDEKAKEAGAASPAASPGPKLRLSSEQASLALLEFNSDLSHPDEDGYGLASQSLCARKVFKMSGKRPDDVYGMPSGLDLSVSKTAWLVAIGPAGKVGVWIDDEFGYPCSGGSPSDLQRMNFEINRATNEYYDKLSLSHLQNLAAEMESVTDRLTSTYGAISDVDKNSRVNILISPEVNRSQFGHYSTSTPDNFRAAFYYKPEDLAKYDATANPRSNEGETLYLWAPDPLGIYSYSQFPSANSLTSNYAKGYLASQLMTLIITNSHLLLRKDKVAEERWLIEALAQLGAAYTAGNDWPFFHQVSYLTSRTHQLSLNGKSIADSKFARDEELGYRALFAWYLHSRICGATAVSPCAGIKALIDTDDVGTANLEKVLKSSMADIVENYGLSVGLELTDNPAGIRGAWKDSYPPKAFAMPGLADISPVPKTIESNALASGFINPAEDPATAGPFPSKDMFSFQTLLPDSDLELKVAKNSVAFVLVTGTVEKTSETFATLGPRLKVVFVPIGDRDKTRHALHVEKFSENAPLDQRPTNLTKTKDATTTNYVSPYYDAASTDANYSVTTRRDLRIFGSIDNFKVNAAGVAKEIGDNDSYTLMISPCKGLVDAELSTCQGTSHRVIVQNLVQDFPLQLLPMTFSTTTDLGVFRGRASMARVTEVDPLYTEPDTKNSVSYLCEADTYTSAAWSRTTNVVTVTTAIPHGIASGQSIIVTPSTANTAIGGTKTVTAVPTTTTLTFADTAADSSGTLDFSSGLCANSGRRIIDAAYTNLDKACVRNASGLCTTNGRITQAAFYDHHTQMPVVYDNFLHSGSLLYGSAFFNYGLITWDNAPARYGIRSFNDEELIRQFFIFDFNKDLDPYYYNVYSTNKTQAANIVPKKRAGATYTALSDTQLAALLDIKTRLATPGDTATPPYEQPCSDLDIPTSLCNFAPAGVVNATTKASLIAAWLAVSAKGYLVCTGSCTSVETLISPPAPQFTAYLTNYKTISNFITYYRPSEPYVLNDYCSGKSLPIGTVFQPNPCRVLSSALQTDRDIRRQLNVPASRLRLTGCDGANFSDFDVCFDNLSYVETTDSLQKAVSIVFREVRGGERKHPHNLKTQPTVAAQLPTNLARASGELLSKTGMLYYLSFMVPGNVDTPINLLVGGRKQSQGKYMLRVRIKDSFDTKLYDP